jgi:hypothetical protein
MGPYRDPEAALRVGQTISAHLNKSDISLEQLAQRLGLKPGAKVINLSTGRHYFPLKLAKITAEILDIGAASFLRLVLLQYHPKEGVDDVFKIICAYFQGQEPTGIPDKKKRRKKKKSHRAANSISLTAQT